MQQPQMTVIQRLNDAFAQEIMSKPFPVERLSYDWRIAALKALEYASPSSLGVNAEVFAKLASMEGTASDFDLSFFEFATLSNNLEARSANELGLGMPKYISIVTEAYSHVKYYSDAVAAIRKEVEKRIADEDAMKKAVERGNGMSPVKGEA